jgi:3-hydroxyisobutyrate dehydrogenase
MSTVAFLGLGNMGRPMARNLARAGHAVRGWDVMAAAREAFAADGGTLAEGQTEALRDAEMVVTMLPAGQHMRAAYLEPGGILAATAARRPLLIDCSTIDVQTARDVAKAAALEGVAMLDAPVSGGVGGATAGTLTFMVGGEAEAFARAAPLLRAMGRNVVHAGAAGAGQAAKICNNMMLGIEMIATAEAFVLADRLGLDRQKLFDIASVSSGQSWSLTTYCPVPGPVPASPANRDYAPGFAAALMLKDLLLAQQAAEASGAATPLGAHAARLYQALADAGEGARDFSVMFAFLSEQWRGETTQ